MKQINKHGFVGGIDSEISIEYFHGFSVMKDKKFLGKLF